LSAALAQVEPVSEFRARLGECPTWDDGDQCLWWVDIPGHLVLRTTPDGATERLSCPAAPGSLARTTDDRLLVALADGFAIADPASKQFVRMVDLPHGQDMMMNDGKCDPSGRFLAGSMNSLGLRYRASLYSLERARLTVLVSGITTSNGLDWSPDGSTLYYIDSGTRRIDAFDYDVATGAVANRRPLHTFDPDLGQPDGLTVDEEAGIWVTLWGSGRYSRGGGRLVRIAPSGALDATFLLPTEGSTSCTFGGAGLRLLYITTSYEFLTPAQRARQPLAGRLLAFEPGLAGARPATRYRAQLSAAAPPTAAIPILG
jgi:sugar lactone lactonase YvrE